MTTGQIIEGKRRPSQEIRNLGTALELVAQLVGSDVVREADLRTIHATLLEGLDHNAGRYRPHNVKISNAKFRPPEHFDVSRLMYDLVKKLESPPPGTTGFVLGVYAHWATARIHPFVDGNGRMARIMQDLVFLRHRLVPAPVPYQEMDDYYAALEQADEGKTGPFVELIARATLEALRKYRAAIEEIKQTDDWLGNLITEANATLRDRVHSVFSRTSKKWLKYETPFRQLRSVSRRAYRDSNVCLGNMAVLISPSSGKSRTRDDRRAHGTSDFHFLTVIAAFASYFGTAGTVLAPVTRIP